MSTRRIAAGRSVTRGLICGLIHHRGCKQFVFSTAGVQPLLAPAVRLPSSNIRDNKSSCRDFCLPCMCCKAQLCYIWSRPHDDLFSLKKLLIVLLRHKVFPVVGFEQNLRER